MSAIETGDRNRIVSLLRQVDIDTLRSLAGKTVVNAVRLSFQTNVESELAEVVFLRYGFGLLADKRIRKSILDTLKAEEISILCERVGVTATKNIQKHLGVQSYFEYFTPEKSKALADFLGVDSRFYLYPSYDTRADVETVEVGYGETLEAKPFLHPYQKRVKDQLVQKLGADGARFIVQMPTGAGKTYTALEAIVDVARKPWQNKFIVWLVDSNELCEQALTSFRDLWRLKGDQPNHIFRLFADFEPDFRNYRRGVVFAGFAKLYSVLSNPSHKLYESVSYVVSNCTLLVVDEAHASVAETRDQCISAFMNRSISDIVGLTATPARTNSAETEALSRLYTGQLITLIDEQGKKIPDPIGFLQQEGYLASVNIEPLETGASCQEGSEAKLLDFLAADEVRNARIVEQIVLAHEAREPTVVFGCTKEHVFALRVLCKAKKIPAEHITGEVLQAERIKILDRFRRGEFFILLNLDILSTGIDVPNVKKLIITRPIASRIQYSQILGRALRGPKNGGNPANTIINIKDNLTNYPGANTLYEWFAQEYQS